MKHYSVLLLLLYCANETLAATKTHQETIAYILSAIGYDKIVHTNDPRNVDIRCISYIGGITVRIYDVYRSELQSRIRKYGRDELSIKEINRIIDKSKIVHRQQINNTVILYHYMIAHLDNNRVIPTYISIIDYKRGCNKLAPYMYINENGIIGFNTDRMSVDTTQLVHKDSEVMHRYKLAYSDSFNIGEYNRFVSLYLKYDNASEFSNVTRLPVHDMYMLDLMKYSVEHVKHFSSITVIPSTSYNWTHELVDTLVNITDAQADDVYLQVDNATLDTVNYIKNNNITVLYKYKSMSSNNLLYNSTAIVNATVQEIKASIKWMLDNPSIYNASNMDNKVIGLLDIYKQYKHLVDIPPNETIHNRLQHFGKEINPLIDSKNIHIVPGLVSDIQYLTALHVMNNLYPDLKIKYTRSKYDKVDERLYISYLYDIAFNLQHTHIYRPVNRQSIHLGDCAYINLYISLYRLYRPITRDERRKYLYSIKYCNMTALYAIQYRTDYKESLSNALTNYPYIKNIIQCDVNDIVKGSNKLYN